MPPKGVTLREAVSNILYACAGDKIQYSETIDAIINALEMYISQLTITALNYSDSPNKIKHDAILAAIANDLKLQAHVQANFDFYLDSKKKEDKPKDKDLF